MYKDVNIKPKRSTSKVYDVSNVLDFYFTYIYFFLKEHVLCMFTGYGFIL